MRINAYCKSIRAWSDCANTSQKQHKPRNYFTPNHTTYHLPKHVAFLAYKYDARDRLGDTLKAVKRALALYVVCFRLPTQQIAHQSGQELQSVAHTVVHRMQEIDAKENKKERSKSEIPITTGWNQ